MNRIDLFALEKIYSPLAGWARHRLGLGQWQLSLECLNGHLVFYLAGIALTVGQSPRTEPIYPVMLAALLWLMLMQAVRHVAKRQARSSLGVQTARLAEGHVRTLLLLASPLMALSVGDLAEACYAIALALLACHFCFKACDAPPPQGRRNLAFGGG